MKAPKGKIANKDPKITFLYVFVDFVSNNYGFEISKRVQVKYFSNVYISKF